MLEQHAGASEYQARYALCWQEEPQRQQPTPRAQALPLQQEEPGHPEMQPALGGAAEGESDQQQLMPQALLQEAIQVVQQALEPQSGFDGRWMWGTQQLPQDADYRYLGIQLSDDCSWTKHADAVRDKCLRIKGLLAGIFKNKQLHTDVKRIMLLAVVRPVAEYGATVWHANANQQSALESVQHQILSSMTGCPNTTSAHILRMETGCRSFRSWFDQRKLEYYFKLKEMPANRLPKLVWQFDWEEGRRRGGQLKMWDAHTQAVAESVGMSDLEAACSAVNSYQCYKKQVSQAVRKRYMQAAHTDAARQTTLARYLPMLGPGTCMVPNTLQPYLSGPGPTLHTRLKLQFRSSTAAVAHRKELLSRHSTRQQHVSNHCPCCSHDDETHLHFLLHCPHYNPLRAQLSNVLTDAVGEEKVAQWEGLQDEERYQTLLSDHFWGSKEAGSQVDEIVQKFVVSAWEARQLVIRGQSAVSGAGPHGHVATGTAQ